jgi:hypothetical protein
MLIILAALGLTLIGFLIFEFAVTQIRLMTTRVATELEVIREDIKAKGELKKKRLAKKREAYDKYENIKIDTKIKAMHEEATKKPEEDE